MLRKAPYTVPDPRAFTTLISWGVREVDKIYGPVATKKIIKYALEFLEQRISERPSGSIETLDQLVEYLVSKVDKYPRPYCAISYGHSMMEHEFQGQSGAAVSLVMIGISREVLKNEKERTDRTVDFDKLLAEYREGYIGTNVAIHEMGYRKNSDGSAEVLWLNCQLIDRCRQAYDEGALKKPSDKLFSGKRLL